MCRISDIGGCVLGRRRIKPIISSKPREDDTGVAQAVKFLAHEAKEALSTAHEDWQTWYNYRDGRQWPNRETAGKKSDRLVLNGMYPTYYHGKAMMTEALPEPIYEERITQDETKARLLQYEWDLSSQNSRFPLQMTEAVGNAITYGAGIIRPRWDPDIRDGWGGVVFESWPVWGVLPDPAGKSPRDLGYVIYARDVSRRTLESQYGPLDEKTWALMKLGVAAANKPAPEQYERGRTAIKDVARQYEIFIRNGRIGRSKDVRKEYEAPWGPVVRYIRVIGSCVLHDGPSWYGSILPIVRVLTDALEGEFWGRSRMKQLKDIQDMINQRNHAVSQAFAHAGAPTLIIDREAEVDQKVKAVAGGVIFKNMGAKIDWIRGPGPSGAEIAAIGDGVTLMDRFGMIQAVSQGIRPKGITSGVAINQLQTAAQSGTRLQMRYVGDAVKDCAEMLPKLLQRLYIRRRPVALEGMLFSITGEVFKGDWMVRVDTQPMLPTDSLAAYQQLTQLVQTGAVTPDILLEKAPFISDATRVQQKRKMEQMAEAAQAEQGPQGAVMPQEVA